MKKAYHARLTGTARGTNLSWYGSSLTPVPAAPAKNLIRKSGRE